MDSAFQSGLASASLQVIFEKIASFAISKIGLILGVDDELEKLNRTVVRIQALVDHVESSQFDHNMWRFWLHDVRGMLYDADDLLGEISLEFFRVKSHGSMNLSDRNQVRNMILTRLKFRLPDAINDILKKLENVAREIDSPIMTEIIKRHEIMVKGWSSSSFVDESVFTGRVREKAEIMRLVMSADWEENIVVVPIVGMGGIGKTMLAQVIYNDRTIAEAFDFRIWISVSTSSDVMEVTKSIVESLMGKTLKLSNLDPIQLKLQEIIKDKKIFLVLDDMWDENPQNWNVMKLPFRAAARGSKILVTTRSTFVSSIVSTTPPYKLRPLSNGDCWELIKKRALSNRNTDNVENLVVIGEKIAEKCEGIPLAANTLGHVLRLKSEENQWNDVLSTELRDLPEARNVIFSSLRLSFDRLSPHLKICFAYCSIFPPNYEFEKENLVLLWAAEGFVQAEGTRRVEDIGRGYFDELLGKSFFYPVNVSHQQRYKMDGLLHKFGELISTDICFRFEDEMSSLVPMPRHPRHAFLRFRRFQRAILEEFYKYKGLRTFMVQATESDFEIPHESDFEIPHKLFSQLRSLRVLNLSSTLLSKLPESIENLKQLHYLDVSQTLIRKLPESTSNLSGLHTLKLRNCSKLLELPKNTSKMTELQHLDLDIRQLKSMPPNFGKLSKLQTLNAFIVGKDEGFQITELQNLNNIRGSLCITRIENVGSSEEAKLAKLGDKSHLEILELLWDKENPCIQDRDAQVEVLVKLRPHDGLKELTITKYSGFTFPSWLSDPTFSKLVTINLHHCRYCKMLLALGQLPALEFLYITGMHELEYINNLFCGSGTSGGFPALKKLRLCDMPKLQKWEGLNATAMPKLSELSIVECPLLGTIPSLEYLRNLEKLEFWKCPKLSLPPEPLPDSLEELIITDCDVLKERCGTEEGADWSKIRSIRRIEIDYNEILVPGDGN